MKKLFAFRVAAAGSAIALFSTGALAEDYVQAGYASAKVKSDALGVTFDGYDLGAGLRYDFVNNGGLFGTLALGTGSVDNSDLGVKIKLDQTSYGAGLGYANHPTKDTEVNVQLRYAHGDDTLSAPGFGSTDSTSDEGVLSVGGHAWLNNLFRAYGEVGYVKASHASKGPELEVGLEVRPNPSFGLFLAYSYASLKDDSDTVKTSLIGGGVKIPFGGIK